VVEGLTSKCKVLHSNPSTTKREKERKREKREREKKIRTYQTKLPNTKYVYIWEVKWPPKFHKHSEMR
jgi:hypothetical protein